VQAEQCPIYGTGRCNTGQDDFICAEWCPNYNDGSFQSVVMCTPDYYRQRDFWTTNDWVETVNDLDDNDPMDGKAWYNPGYPEGGFYIFHSRDGAGMQNDCVGGTNFVEHYKGNGDVPWEQYTCSCTPEDGYLYDWRSPDTDYQGGYPGFDFFVPCENQRVDGDPEQFHVNCQFTHPGTKFTFLGFETGQWGEWQTPGHDEKGNPVNDDTNVFGTLVANIEKEKEGNGGCKLKEGSDKFCWVDYSACGLDAGEHPTWPANEWPYPDVDKFYIRLEQFVCHEDFAGYSPDDESAAHFAGNPRINCLSDNEAWTYASASASGQPVANPNQYVLYVGMERDDSNEVVAMHMRAYDFCGRVQGEEFELRRCEYGDTSQPCFGVYR
jgi:hypothetical protein